MLIFPTIFIIQSNDRSSRPVFEFRIDMVISKILFNSEHLKSAHNLSTFSIHHINFYLHLSRDLNFLTTYVDSDKIIKLLARRFNFILYVLISKKIDSCVCWLQTQSIVVNNVGHRFSFQDDAKPQSVSSPAFFLGFVFCYSYTVLWII